MLISFSVKNFSSIADWQTLSMVPSKKNLRKGRDRFLLETGCDQVPYVLPVALIYGANAAGKSAMVSAMNILFYTSVYSFESKTARYRPHVGIESLAGDPTCFEIEIALNEKVYRYELSYCNNEFTHEALHVLSGKSRSRERTIFAVERGKGPIPDISLHPDLVKGDRTQYISRWQPDRTFLSQLYREGGINVGMLLYDFMEWMHRSNHIHDVTEKYPWIGPHEWCFYSEEERLKLVSNFLKSIEPTIKNIRFAELTDSEAERQGVKRSLMGDSYAAAFQHNGFHRNMIIERTAPDGGYMRIPFQEESTGTRQLIEFGQVFVELFHGEKRGHGGTFVVDELGNALHPEALDWLLDAYTDPSVNTHGAQLIFTTHATHAMDHSQIDTDQIWFAEKNDAFATEIYSMAEFNRAASGKSTSLERSYLAGKFGALPHTTALE